VAGIPGAYKLFQSQDGERYLAKHSLHKYMPAATHIVWATGGSVAILPAVTLRPRLRQNLSAKFSANIPFAVFFRSALSP
jgi:D-serine dehydratase